MSANQRVAFGPLFVLAVTMTLIVSVLPAGASGVGGGGSYNSLYYYSQAYGRIGGGGAIGWPVNDVHRWGQGCNQDYNGGRYGSSAIMQMNCSGPAYVVVGATWRHLIEQFGGGAVNVYGYPLNDGHRWGAGWVQDFSYGALGWNIMIYGDSVGRTQNVRGDIWRYYRETGGMDGPYGAPTTDEYAWQGYSRQDFVGGSLIWNGATTMPLSALTPPRQQRAANWAVAEKNSPDPTWSDESWSPWSGQCEFFVEVAYGTRGRFSSAIAHYYWQRNAGRIHTDTNPPAGAIVFYGGGGGYGHVGISLGNGQMVSTQGFWGQRLPIWQLGITALQSTNPYLGWAYAPDDWPGR